jgi:predicted KAP-like P-loop ATPase
MSGTDTSIRYGGRFQGMFVLGDAPAGRQNDRLSFDRYVEPLVSVIADPFQETPFTIGIFGPWGSGKSSLLRMISEELRLNYAERFVLVEFNAWIHRGEPNILVPLLHTLRDSLEKDRKNRFTASVAKLGHVLVNLGADLILKAVTAGNVSLENLEKLEKQYLERRFRVESEMRNLRSTLQAEVESINLNGARLVIAVDDLDRCEPDQIIGLLDAVKLFLDIPDVFVILAVDREVVRRGIQVRYKEFKFADGRDDVIGHEYLEKMVQLPVELFPLSDGQVTQFVENSMPGKLHEKARALVKSVALPNARKIKRLVNTYVVIRSLMQTDDTLKTLNDLTLLRLIAIQVQFPELYGAVVRMPRALEALELTYSGKHKLDADYAIYQPLQAEILKLCKEFHRPDTLLAKVFSGSEFSQSKKDLPQYLSMLGVAGA